MAVRLARFENVTTDFHEFAVARSRSFFVQFKEIFVRNILYLTRNRKAFAAIVFNASAIALMILSVFYKIGDFPDLYHFCETDGQIDYNKVMNGCTSKAANAYQVYVTNLTGLAFMISNQLSISASINVILQVPL